MMRSSRTLGSLTWGAEPDEGLDWSDMMPFPRENAILTVYKGGPPLGMSCVPNLSPKALTHYS
jgi:hypothetical protein